MGFLNWFTSNGQPAVTVVSGLPRSGTSMLMKMLAAGGMEAYSDGVRTADDDNPLGYFEHERIMGLADDPDPAWVAEARGKAIKVIAYLLDKLPADNRYDVIYVTRSIEEVVASQNRMLLRRGEPVPESALDTARMLQVHSRKVRLWLKRQPNFRFIEIDYAETIDDPQGRARDVAAFVDARLDPVRMAGAVDRSLYRNRSLYEEREQT